ncbi:hypothetical protein [Nostoc sp.]
MFVLLDMLFDPTLNSGGCASQDVETFNARRIKEKILQKNEMTAFLIRIDREDWRLKIADCRLNIFGTSPAPNTVQLRIIVGWVERSETQQIRENVGFCSSTQPTHLRGFWR